MTTCWLPVFFPFLSSWDASVTVQQPNGINLQQWAGSIAGTSIPAAHAYFWHLWNTYPCTGCCQRWVVPNIQQQVREAPSVPVCWWRAFLNGLGKGQDVCLKLERRMQMTCTECYFLSRASQDAPFLFSNFYQLNSLLISEETPRWFSSFFEWEVKYFSLHKCNIQGCLFWCTCKLTLRASLLCFDTIVHQVDNC